MQKLALVLVRKNGNNNETLIDSYVEVLKKLFFNHKPEKLNHELESLISKNFNNELYLVFYEGVPIGITGLYWGNEEDICWYNWFGVLKEYRNHGFGKEIFSFKIHLAKQSFKGIRLYTDDSCDIAIHYLYEKFFDFKERIGDTIIYSKSFSKDFHMNCYGKIPWGLYETE